MDVIINPGRLGYEVQFSTPSLDLLERSTELLRSFYNHLGSQFSLSSSDLYVSEGSSLADTSVRVALFGGNGRIEVTVDELSFEFENLQTVSDIAICQDCLAASERVIEEFWSDMNFGSAVATLNYFVELGDEIESASDYLSRLTGPGISLDLGEIEGAIKHPGIRLEIENEDERWDTFIGTDRHVGEKKILSVSAISMFDDDSSVQGAENRVDLLNRLISLYFKGIGLNVSIYPLTST